MSPLKQLPAPFLFLVALYFATSLGHFTHNAEFICDYPNLPLWLTRAKVYGFWLAITAVGAFGFLLLHKRFVSAGLALVAVYAAPGFDGLGHYAVAPLAFHTFGANATILAEVAAGACLLVATLCLIGKHLAVTHFYRK